MNNPIINPRFLIVAKFKNGKTRGYFCYFTGIKKRRVKFSNDVYEYSSYNENEANDIIKECIELHPNMRWNMEVI